ncbi:MAG TPA: hypothetical protein VFI88_05125 [Sphingomicrobium sp.]|nr:hypothetical protein [Sphingomicrobium sp.]
MTNQSDRVLIEGLREPTLVVAEDGGRRFRNLLSRCQQALT